MKIFITGAAGFIGTNLIKHFDNFGYKIGYCDNLFSSTEQFTSPNLVKCCNDISEITPDILSNYDTLIHLAAVKKHNALDSLNENLLYDTNFYNTARLFNIAGLANVKNIIFTSSLYANGQMHKLLVKETDPISPLTLYGQSKIFGEYSLEEKTNFYGYNSLALRLYFIYGPNQYSGKGYPSIFLKSFDRLKTNSSPIIINDGMQRLDYLNVEDLCKLIHLAVEYPLPGFNIVNASSANAYSINYIVNNICQSWNKKFNTNFIPKYSGSDFTNGTFRSGDNSKAKSIWEWEPKVNIHTGLNNMLNWYLENKFSDFDY